MDEEEFDSLMQAQPFGTKDAMREDARLRRCASLGSALWGSTVDDLRRQLLAPHPEIPSGFDLADFRELQRSLQIFFSLIERRTATYKWLPHFSAGVLSVGAQRFNAWEARFEIVRRAIEYLDNGQVP